MSAAAAQDAKSAPPADLPEGAAKSVVAAQCIGCHDLSRILNANHSAAEWRNVVNMMVAAGARLSPAEKDAVARYLIESFPERARPRPVVIAGPVQVSFREWEVPTPGARPHDPLATPDGALWYTGQMANILGRLDPSTGAIKEYPLKEFRARGRFSSLADEPFAEDDGELGLGLEPLARRPFPFVSRVVQNQV